METTAINHNSTRNQKIKGEFVQREIFGNVNEIVEFSLRKSQEGDQDAPVQFDEIENMFVFPEYRGKYAQFRGGSEEMKQEEIDRLEELLEEVDEETALQDEIKELEDLEDEVQEIFEWWMVSSMLYNDLKGQGEPVVSDGSNNYWGRTTTGQAIMLDGVISQICENLQILEGQEREWK